MKKKMIWGVATLIVLLLGVSAFLLLRNTDTESPIIYRGDVEPLEITQTPVTENKPPRPAREGYEWEWHGDHWHEMPITQQVDAPDVPPHKIAVDDRFSGASLYSKVAASDEVPTYAELKAMPLDALSQLYKSSLTKAKSYDAEVNKRWEAWAAVSAASQEGEALETSLNVVLKKQFVHAITSDKAFDVFQWRSLLQLQKNPLPNLQVQPIPEPFDP